MVEQTVAAPLENQINGVENMMYMSSTSSSDGSYSLTITFDIGADGMIGLDALQASSAWVWYSRASWPGTAAAGRRPVGDLRHREVLRGLRRPHAGGHDHFEGLAGLFEALGHLLLQLFLHLLGLLQQGVHVEAAGALDRRPVQQLRLGGVKVRLADLLSLFLRVELVRRGIHPFFVDLVQIKIDNWGRPAGLLELGGLR